MFDRSRPSLLAALAVGVVGTTVGAPQGLDAQDLFGREVGVVGAQVLVTKPLVGVGPATAYAFEWVDGEWRTAGLLRPEGGTERGEALSPALDVLGSDVLLASGDPTMMESAHLFSLDGGGGWSFRGTAPLDPSAAPASGGAPEVTMATVMAILQPPARVVAGGPERLAVGVLGSTSPTGEPVRVLARDPAGRWVEEAVLAPADSRATDRFGAALAMNGDRLAVGAPGRSGTGVVFLYQRGDAGEWTVSHTLAGPEDAEAGAAFGAALEWAGDHVLIGAPGGPNHPGALYVASPDEGTLVRKLSRADREGTGAAMPGDGFGSAVAFHASADGSSTGELWVGSPGVDQGSGVVERFGVRGDASFEHLGTLAPSGREPGFGFGSSVALGATVGVAGAPFAYGGTGAAAAVQRSNSSPESWGEPTWLERGDALQDVRGAQVDCTEDGQAAGFDCDDVDLLAFLPLASIGAEPGERVSDLWGWTDPSNGREYALVGRTAGLALVDVTDASAPRYLGLVPANPSGARDVKVYQDHAFFTGDGAGEHGLVVFDLRRLRDAPSTPTEFEPDARYTGIASAHNLVLDPEAGFAYPVGASGGGETCGGGLHMVDVRDPKNPTFAGCFTDTEGLIWVGRTHDAQCVVYRGPDEQYQGREICFVSNETAVRIVDVTDKANPVPLGAGSYPGVAYVHQGWLTDDHRYFYLNDELDELVGTTERTRTLIWDVSELDDPVMVGDHLGANGATDHNLYVKGDRMYQANYQAGFRVFDISDPLAPEEIGFFDTTPYEGDPPGFVGAWTAFPYFESGTVIVSSMNEGLFLLKPKRELIP